MLVEMAPRPSTQARPATDMCDNACQVGCGPLLTSVSTDSGTAAARHSQANRSNIRTSCARRSNKLPTAKLTGEIISTANAPTLKSYPTVPQIISSPKVATPIPTVCIRVGRSPNSIAAKAMVNSAWLCTITLESPTGTPCAIPKACARNWPRNSVKLIAISTGQETLGLRINRHGSAAIAKRSVVISSGENSSSAIRLATNARPQITATRTAIKTSAGFIFLTLFAGFRFAQKISAVQRRVIIDRDDREAGIGQHALDHPAKRRIFVAHMANNAVAIEIVVLDAEIGPALDVALRAIGYADEDDVAQIEIRSGLQRVIDPRQRHRLPEVRQMVQRELADDQVIGIGLVGETQQSRRLGAHRHPAVARLDFGERQHRRRNVDRIDLGAHQRRFAGQGAVAAAAIGDAPAALETQHGQRGAGAAVAVVVPVVNRGNGGIEPKPPPLRVVPVARQHLTSPRAHARSRRRRCATPRQGRADASGR